MPQTIEDPRLKRARERAARYRGAPAEIPQRSEAPTDPRLERARARVQGRPAVPAAEPRTSRDLASAISERISRLAGTRPMGSDTIEPPRRPEPPAEMPPVIVSERGISTPETPDQRTAAMTETVRRSNLQFDPPPALGPRTIALRAREAAGLPSGRAPMRRQPEAPEQTGVTEAAGKGLAAGMLSVAESVGTGARYLGGRTGSEALQRWGEEAESVWGERAKRFEAPEEIEGAVVDRPELLANPVWWAYNVAQIAPSLAASMIPGVGAARAIQIGGQALRMSPAVIARLARLGGGVTGGVVGGGLEGAGTYREVLERGADEETAARTAELMTAASAALNALSVGKALSPGAWSGIRQFLTTGATEALTEYLEEPAEIAIKLGLLPEGMYTREEAIEQLKEGLNVVGPAFVTGGLGGIATQGEARRIAPTGTDAEQQSGASPAERLEQRQQARTSRPPAEEGAPSPPGSLRRRLARVLDPERDRELETTRAQRDEARREAETDPLTGAGNRMAFQRAQAAAEGDPEVSFLTFDLNNLKAANDLVGHEFGDEMIRRAAAAIEKSAGYRIFRTGGDEFVALVPADQAQELLEQAEAVFGEEDARGYPVSLSGSIGSTYQEADAGLQARKEARKGEEGSFRPVSAVPRPPAERTVEDPSPVRARQLGTLRRVRRQLRRLAPEAEALTEAPRSPQELPESVAIVPTDELHRDPERFQYKATGAGGVTAELKQIEKFDPKLSGIIMAWRDPSDGRSYVVNGHHRHELAQRTRYPEMLVRYINDDATTAEEARTIGALSNIAEGRGTPVDAAKIFRQIQVGPEGLKERGISITGAIARDGLALANLAPSLFTRVATGDLSIARGVVIGRSNLTPEQQIALAEMVDQQEIRGKKVLDRDIAELARFVAGAGETTLSQETLFGTEETTQSLALVKASLSSWIRDRLGREKRTFGYVAKGERAGAIEGAGVGTIDTEKAGAIATQAAQAEEIYAKESLYTGPISETLNEAAREIAEGGNEREIRRRTYERIRELVAAVISGEPGASAPRAETDDRREGGEAAEVEAPAPASSEEDLFGAPAEPAPAVPASEPVAPEATPSAEPEAAANPIAALEAATAEVRRLWDQSSSPEFQPAVTARKQAIDTARAWMRENAVPVEQLEPGMIVLTSYDTGPYRIKTVKGPHVVMLDIADTRKRPKDSYLNDVRRIEDGTWKSGRDDTLYVFDPTAREREADAAQRPGVPTRVNGPKESLAPIGSIIEWEQNRGRYGKSIIRGRVIEHEFDGATYWLAVVEKEDGDRAYPSAAGNTGHRIVSPAPESEVADPEPPPAPRPTAATLGRREAVPAAAQAPAEASAGEYRSRADALEEEALAGFEGPDIPYAMQPGETHAAFTQRRGLLEDAETLRNVATAFEQHGFRPAKPPNRDFQINDRVRVVGSFRTEPEEARIRDLATEDSPWFRVEPVGEPSVSFGVKIDQIEFLEDAPEPITEKPLSKQAISKAYRSAQEDLGLKPEGREAEEHKRRGFTEAVRRAEEGLEPGRKWTGLDASGQPHPASMLARWGYEWAREQHGAGPWTSEPHGAPDARHAQTPPPAPSAAVPRLPMAQRPYTGYPTTSAESIEVAQRYGVPLHDVYMQHEEPPPGWVPPPDAEPAMPARPSPETGRLVKRLRSQADSLQRRIDVGRAPRLANTPKRARQAASAMDEANRLEEIQTQLRGIADNLEAGTLPESLAGINTRATIETIRSYTEMPTIGTHKGHLSDLIEGVKGLPGTATPIRRLKPLLDVEHRVDLSRHLDDFEALEKVAKKRIEKLSSREASTLRFALQNIHHGIDPAKRLRAAGISTQEQLDQARTDLRALAAPDPEAARRAAIQKRELALVGTKLPGYFPTPRPLVDHMLELAAIQADERVLEPSAGKGSIADVIRDDHPDAQLDVVEIAPKLRELLQDKGHNVIGSDFLELKEGDYDVIVMNPPFEQRQDVAHVRHAFDLLAPGGRVVAIMGEGSFFGTDSAAVEFRDWLESFDGTAEKNPAGAFKSADRPTGVASRTVVIEKPVADVEAARPADPNADELREALKVSAEALEAYDVVAAVSKGRTEWHYRDINGKETPDSFKTKREAIAAATRHLELKQDQYDNPGRFTDLVRVRARKRLALIEKYQAQGMTEMDAGRRARQEVPDATGQEKRPPTTRESPAPYGAWTFELSSSRKVGGGSKTYPGDEMLWRGTFLGKPIQIRTRPRNIEPNASFNISSNARIHFNTEFPQYVDVEVLNRPELTDEDLRQLALMAAAADGRPASARLKGEPVRERPFVAAEDATTTLTTDQDQIRLLEGRAPYGAERIVAAAWQSSDGRVFRGTDHGDALRSMRQSGVTGSTRTGEKKGFVTSSNRFVGESEAKQIAISARQTSRRSGDEEFGGPFVSEDLDEATLRAMRTKGVREGGVDLFGEPEPSREPEQGSMLPAGAGPQGRTAALNEARQTISLLEGKVARGAAKASEVRRFESAKSLLRSLTGQALTAEDIRRIAREAAEGRPVEPGDTGELFGDVREPRATYDIDRPRFYSRLQRAIEAAPFERAPAEQWAGYLGKQPIAGGERDWTDIDRMLDNVAGAQIEKSALLDLAQKKGVQLTETVLSGERTPEVERLNAEAARLQEERFQERTKLESVFRHHGYSEEEVFQYTRGAGPPLNALRPAPEEERTFRNAELLLNLHLGEHVDELFDLGFDTRNEAMNALVHGREDLQVWDLPSRTLDLARWTREAYDAFDAARTQPVDPAVAEALTRYREVYERWERADRAARRADEGRPKPKYETYSLPGGENYREILVRLDQPDSPRPEVNRLTELPAGYEVIVDRSQDAGQQYGIVPPEQVHARPMAGRHATPQAASEAALARLNSDREARALEAWMAQRSTSTFRSDHWPGVENPLVHIRVNDRTLPNGEKVLFVEEVQSDWHQKGRREGYTRDDTADAELWWNDEGGANEEVPWSDLTATERREAIEQYRDEVGDFSEGVPDAPFKKTDEWIGLAARRVIDEAVQGGYDRVAWTTGEQQADRFDLSKQIAAISFNGDTGGLRAYNHSGSQVINENVLPEQLSDYIGKEAADRLLATPGPSHVLEGVDLQVGGEGMKSFYDRIVPKAFEDATKKAGVKLKREPVREEWPTEEFGVRGDTRWIKGNLSIPITPELAQKVRTEGQMLWERGPEYEADLLERQLRDAGWTDTAAAQIAQAVRGLDPTWQAAALRNILEEGATAGEPAPTDPARQLELGLDKIRRLKVLEKRRAGEALTAEEKRTAKKSMIDQLALDFGSVDAAKAANADLLKRAGDLAEISIPGVPQSDVRRRMVENARIASYAWVNAVGKSVDDGSGAVSRESVYRLFHSYRSPSTEFWHALVVAPDETGEMKVAHHRMSTAGAIDVAFAFPGDMAEAAGIAKRLGGTAYLLHNHPSGLSTPSAEDRDVTRNAVKIFQAAGARFGGHLVINHEIATIIEESGEENTLHLPRDSGETDWTDLYAGKVRSGHDVFTYLSKLPNDGERLDILLLSTQNDVIGFEARPLDEIDSIAEWAPRLVRETGSQSIILGAGNPDAFRRIVATVETFEAGLGILDVLLPQEGRYASAAEQGRSMPAGVPSMRPIFEEKAPYGRPTDVRGEDRPQEGAARLGRARQPAGVRPGREGGRDAGRVREETPRLSSTAQRLIRRRTKPRADLASSATLAPPEIERTPVDVSTGTLYPISPVELVRLGSELLGGQNLLVKKYRAWRGVFYPDPLAPRIGLNVELGKDYEQFARTLAHEIGHLIDFLPDQDMSRGNILGRLATLKGHLSHTIDEVPTDPTRALTSEDRTTLRKKARKQAAGEIEGSLSDEGAIAALNKRTAEIYAEMVQQEIVDRKLLTAEQIREELIALSEWWRPYDRDTASDGHIRYRESSPELYADAMSTLLNSPRSLQEHAPIFFDAFLSYMGRKPDVEQAYNGVQALLAEGSDAVMTARRAELEADFRRGEEIQRAAEDREDPQSVPSYLKQLLVQRTAPLTDAERRRIGNVEPAHSEEHVLKMALEEYAHSDNVNRVMLRNIERKVHRPMSDAGITDEQAGRFLMLVRIADGDRGGFAEQAKEAIMEITGKSTWEEARAAFVVMKNEGPEGSVEFDPDLLDLAESGVLNPHGYTPEVAAQTLEGLRTELGQEKYARIEEIMGDFREILWKGVEEAVRVGSYNQKIFLDRILPNRHTYAPFAVLDYFNGRMPAGVKAQIGTLKGVANPYTTAILKAMSLNRLNEHQKAKLTVLRFLDVDFPGSAGPEQKVDKFRREKKPGPGRDNLTYLRDGKLYYREVDEYIAKSLAKSDLGSAERLFRTLNTKIYGVFHPLYVTWSLGWQARNIQRDWKRTYKNLAAARARQPTYRQVLGAFSDIARLNVEYAKAAPAAWRHARREYDPLIEAMLEDRALGRAFHSFTPNVEDAKYERLMQEYGIRPPAKEGLAEGARRLGSIVETAGVFQETLSKAAAYNLLENAGIVGKERAYIVRNYVGTPDSTRRGLGSEATNSMFMYANVIMAGIRADAEVALQPSTAAGYWLRSVITDFGPKLVMAAAAAGFFGDEADEWMEKVPSYDKEKYLIVPVPPFWSTNDLGERKAVYLRVPHDDLNRIMAGAVWTAVLSERPNRVFDTVGLVAGEFPGLAPPFSMMLKWGQVAMGVNPRDWFRGREVIPRTEWDAGGWYRMKEMMRYTLAQFGIVSEIAGIITRASPLEGEAARGEMLLRSIPGLQSIVKISDQGINERQYWELDWEAQERAKIRADLPGTVRRLVSERARLNRLGVDRLDERDRLRRVQLNDWYRVNYRSQTSAMEQARDTEDPAGYERARLQLEESTGILGQLPESSGTVRREPVRPGTIQRTPVTRPRAERAPAVR